MTYTRLEAAVIAGAVAWHVKPHPTPHLLSSTVEVEAGGKEDKLWSETAARAKDGHDGSRVTLGGLLFLLFHQTHLWKVPPQNASSE